jgi:hypothetical protein
MSVALLSLAALVHHNHLLLAVADCNEDVRWLAAARSYERAWTPRARGHEGGWLAWA